MGTKQRAARVTRPTSDLAVVEELSREEQNCVYGGQIMTAVSGAAISGFINQVVASNTAEMIRNQAQSAIDFIGR